MPKKKRWQIEEEQKKKDNMRYVALGGAMVMLFLAVIFIIIPKPPVSEDFAQCVADSGAKMYGAYWCSHCNNQKTSFGDYWDILKENVYIECDAKGENPQSELCISEGIDGYPTWKFSNGKTLPGELSLEQISEETGCQLK